MGDGTPTTRGGLRGVLWFLVGFTVLLGMNAVGNHEALSDFVWELSDDPETKLALLRLYVLVTKFLGVAYTTTFVTSAIFASSGAVARALLRARVRAGFPDPLDHLRRLVRTWPRLVNVLLAVPPLLYVSALLRYFTLFTEGTWDSVLAGAALPALFTVVAQVILAGRGLRGLLAPTLSEQEASGALRADGFTFTAVAVTTETLGAVSGLAFVSFVMVTLAMALPTSTLVRSPVFAGALLGYLVLAIGGAALFRRASRIRVGLDGVHVSGSARERFIPFREIDRARVAGHTIELVRGDRVVLRLQLHGEDAVRRTPLAARINAAIETARAEQNEPAVAFVSSASTEEIRRAADGASSYRQAPPTREKLFEALESPAVDAEARKAAAAALAHAGSEPERARLRVAAERCAEPSVRARLEELLEADEEPPPPARARAGRRA